MDITYKTKKLEKICTDAKAAERAHGKEMAEIIHQRIDEITAADTVEMMIQFRIGRCHPLKQNRKGQMLLTWCIRIDWFLKNKETEFKSLIFWR